MASINSDLMNEFKEKDEIYIDDESKIYAKILEKVGYIEIDNARRRTCFMKIIKKVDKK